MEKRPNILLILTDQFRGDCIHADGNMEIQTPFLDYLSSMGTICHRGYSPSPTCIPARACLVTGKMPSKTGFFQNNFAQSWDFTHTMMEQLRDGGYQTINVGKNHFKPYRKCLGFEINRVYETGRDEHGEPCDYQLWLNDVTGGRILDTALTSDNNSCVVMPWTEAEYLHPTAWTAAEGVRQLQHRDPTRPFYLQLSFHRPHPPLDPPEAYLRLYDHVELSPPAVGEWAEKYGRPTQNIEPFEGKMPERALQLAKQAYYAQISFIDQQIGKVLAYLAKSRLLENTLIVFTSDHGEMLGDHNMFRKGPAFEGSARIPFILKPPGRSKGRPLELHTPVSLIDLLPTFLDYANLQPMVDFDGRSLRPLLEGVIPESEWDRPYVYGENYRNLPLFGVQAGWDYVVGNRYKYVWDSVNGTEYVFDLQEDPHEMINLAESAQPELQEEICNMRQYLIQQFKHRPGDGLLNPDGTLHFPSLLPSYRPPEWAYLSREDVLSKKPPEMGFPAG